MPPLHPQNPSPLTNTIGPNPSTPTLSLHTFLHPFLITYVNIPSQMSTSPSHPIDPSPHPSAPLHKPSNPNSPPDQGSTRSPFPVPRLPVPHPSLSQTTPAWIIRPGTEDTGTTANAPHRPSPRPRDMVHIAKLYLALGLSIRCRAPAPCLPARVVGWG